MGANATPPTLDPAAGVAALEEDLPRVLNLLGANSIAVLGWQRPSKLTLLVPMTGRQGDTVDTFMLKLGFQAYRAWPPSAQFVNPDTLAFVHGADNHHVPKLTSQECQTHLAYTIPTGGTTQLICCSATMEFYAVQHSIEPQHVWNPTGNFLVTIRAIERAMSEAYQGRFNANGG